MDTRPIPELIPHSEEESEDLIQQIAQRLNELTGLARECDEEIARAQTALAAATEKKAEAVAPVRKEIFALADAVYAFAKRRLGQINRKRTKPQKTLRFAEGNAIRIPPSSSSLSVDNLEGLLKELEKLKNWSAYLKIEKTPIKSAIKRDWDKIGPLKHAHFAVHEKFEIIPAGSAHFLRGTAHGHGLEWVVINPEEKGK